MRNLVVAVRKLGSRRAPILLGTCALMLMSACSSRNPDALTSPNTEQSQPDLNDAMNAIAAAPANSVETSVPKPGALPPTAAAEETKPSPKDSRDAATQRVAAETVNAAVEPDAQEEDPSDASPEEPTNSY